MIKSRFEKVSWGLHKNEVVRSILGQPSLNKMGISTSTKKLGGQNLSDGPETWQAPTL